MNYKFTLVLISFFMASISIGQGISEDLSVVYMKANVLYDQGRFDEAVRMYNLILKQDEDHANALFMRAKAKYELGAYKGTKLDGLSFIEKHGTTKGFIKLLGEAEFKMGNTVAAYNYAKTAIELDPYDAKMHYLLGETALEYTDQNEACEAFARAAILGNSKAERAVNQVCGGISKWIDLSEDRGQRTEKKTEDGSEKTEDVDEKTDDRGEMTEEKKDGDEITLQDVLEIENEKSEDIEEKAEDGNEKPDDSAQKSDDGEQTKDAEEEEKTGAVTKSDIQIPDPVDMNATQDIVIDEKLSLTIHNGLGDRKVEDQPNIFMLSDQDGIVVIDICVNRTGRVIEASFNRGESTILRSSMTSLSLRKAREFLFEASGRAEQCGTIIYRIKS